MIAPLARLFTSHPAAVGESYGKHFVVATAYAFRLIGAGLCAFVHAVLPFLFERTASSVVKAIYSDLVRRGASSVIPTRQIEKP
jgi:Family of unknown function (DUF6356)